jgi:hypothetical protein
MIIAIPRQKPIIHFPRKIKRFFNIDSIKITAVKPAQRGNIFNLIKTAEARQIPRIVNSGKLTSFFSVKKYFVKIYREIIRKGNEYSSAPAFTKRKERRATKLNAVPNRAFRGSPKKSAVLYANNTEMKRRTSSVIQIPVNPPRKKPGTLRKYKRGPLLSTSSKYGNCPRIIP